VSIATLVLAALAFSWAAAVVALGIREALAPVGRIVLGMRAGRRPTRRSGARLAATGAILVAAAVAGPTFGDFVNFSPDIHMIAGAPPQQGLAGGPSGSQAPDSSPGQNNGIIPIPTSTLPPSYRMVPGPITGSVVTEGAIASTMPWANNPPSGAGVMDQVAMPAPWTGGRTHTATLDIYRPPGYPQPGRRYPVIYQAPMTFDYWNTSIRVQSMLDSLITAGTIPPVIVVFAAGTQGPYPDSECANSWDGREWFDRYMATDVVAYVDSHYSTIAKSEGRTLLGFSEGGYCAAALQARHPDVFSQAIAIAGYYMAGIESQTTVNAWRPFNRDPALIRAASAMDLIPGMSKVVRDSLFTVIAADPTVEPFGTQFTAFTQVLESSGVPAAILTVPEAHSWKVVRNLLPTVLQLTSARQVKLGVALGGN
jgi:enterochelin esterase-like enzyme